MQIDDFSPEQVQKIAAVKTKLCMALAMLDNDVRISVAAAEDYAALAAIDLGDLKKELRESV